MPHKLYDGAILIADAHYNRMQRDLESFLQKLLTVPPPQVVFLGDIFDLMVKDFSYLQPINQPLIDLINQLSSKTEVIFLEGNHDFCIASHFPNIKVIPITQQPYYMEWKEHRIALAHGDIGADWKHQLFTTLIRKPLMLHVVHLLSGNIFNNWILKKLTNWLEKKYICGEISHFDAIIQKKMVSFYSDVDYVIEGHYHQGKTLSFGKVIYRNVPGFACGQSYDIVQSSKDRLTFLTKHYVRS